jgi:hypothetical protein
VRYRATGDPVATTLCHCHSCRLAAGAPSLAWVIFPTDGFAFTKGEPTFYNSSPGKVRGFCGRCGTSLTYQREERPQHMDMTTVSLDNPDAFAPTKEIWLREKIAWEEANPRIPHFPESSKKGGG